MPLYGGQMSLLAAFCPGSTPWLSFDVKLILNHMSQQAKRTKAAILVNLSGLDKPFEPPPHTHTLTLHPRLVWPKGSRRASCSKDVVKLAEDEFHRLVLVNHVHRHVAVVPLRTHQSWPEHDADVLGGHSVGAWTLQHSAERWGRIERDTEDEIKRNIMAPDRTFRIFAACGCLFHHALRYDRHTEICQQMLPKVFAQSVMIFRWYSKASFVVLWHFLKRHSARLTFVVFAGNRSTTIGWIATKRWYASRCHSGWIWIARDNKC